MSELTTEDLRKKASELGIKFTKNTSDDTLLSKIETAEKAVAPSRAVNVGRSNAKALKRVKIIPLNPNEQHIPGKFFTFANSYITFKKSVMFKTEIFLEKVMIDHIKGLKYSHIEGNIKDGLNANNNKSAPKKSLLPAYNVVDLPDLTKEQFEALKRDKATRDATIKE